MASRCTLSQITSPSSWPAFRPEGWRSVREQRTGRGYGHTRYDTLDKVPLSTLREASALVARMAMRIANEDNWPVARRNEQAVLEILDSPEYREEAEFRAKLEAFRKEIRA